MSFGRATVTKQFTQTKFEPDNENMCVPLFKITYHIAQERKNVIFNSILLTLQEVQQMSTLLQKI